MSTEPIEMRTVISGPGVYDMDDATYHGDPTPEGSLSNSGAGKILPPKTPAHFRYWQLYGEPPKREFDFGHAAHGLVLGRGLAVDVIVAPDWKSKAAQDARKASYAAGRVPLLEHEWDVVQAMAKELREHPLASALLNPENGTPEQSLFWRHDRTGITLRCRLDFLPRVRFGRKFVIPDYKSADDASEEAFGKAAARFGYNRQDPWYRAGVRALGIHPEPEFVFIVQEKTAPYLVNVIELDDEAREIGARRMDQAITLYARCMETGRWPGYGDGVQLATLPRWATYGEDLP